MKAVRSRAALLLVAALLVGGCAPGGGSTAPPDGGSTAEDFEYGEPITVAPGAVVAVVNMDAAPHTVTAEQGQAFDLQLGGNGATGTFTAPTEPGTYPYICTYHPNMKGTLTVK